MADLRDSGNVIAVWPCDHGGVVVEPGPASNLQCHACGAVASTYVKADEALEGPADA